MREVGHVQSVQNDQKVDIFAKNRIIGIKRVGGHVKIVEIARKGIISCGARRPRNMFARVSRGARRPRNNMKIQEENFRTFAWVSSGAFLEDNKGRIAGSHERTSAYDVRARKKVNKPVRIANEKNVENVMCEISE